ncbi:glycoside hydrolase family 95-like protein, partial [Paenibacillus sp. MCAF20]
LMTDHDTNRRNHCYCTDTLFGVVASVNETLLFSNTGEIELLPALPSDWESGSMDGLMARTQVEVKQLSWDLLTGTAKATLNSRIDDNTVRLSAGVPWTKVIVNGEEALANEDDTGKFIVLTLNKAIDVSIDFI